MLHPRAASVRAAGRDAGGGFRRSLPCILAIILLACFSSLGLAQVVSSSIIGTLVDPADAAVPGIAVSATNEATGATFKTESNAAGLFRFPNLLAGTYTLSVQATGFKAYQQQSIVLSSSETRDLGHVVLQLGSLSESVSVTAEATPLQTASSEKSSLVTGTQLSAIALKGRDFFGMVDTLPGVVDTRNRDATSNAGTLSGLSINGLANNTINYTIDGVTANDTGSNSDIHYNGNMDAIAEVRVLTSNYQAEFGRKAGATISVITRGGGRDFHGGGYWSHRHEQFNANNFFNNRSGIAITPYRFNIAGYNLSGPVVLPGGFNKNRDKLFFFFGQEYTRQRINLGTQYRTMPTALERSGDFSQSFDTGGKLIPAIDPLTRHRLRRQCHPQVQAGRHRRVHPELPAACRTTPTPTPTCACSAITPCRPAASTRAATTPSGSMPTSPPTYTPTSASSRSPRARNRRLEPVVYRLHLPARVLEASGAPVAAWPSTSPIPSARPSSTNSPSARATRISTTTCLNDQNLDRSKMNNIPQWYTGSTFPDLGDQPRRLSQGLAERKPDSEYQLRRHPREPARHRAVEHAV